MDIAIYTGSNLASKQKNAKQCKITNLFLASYYTSNTKSWKVSNTHLGEGHPYFPFGIKVQARNETGLPL